MIFNKLKNKLTKNKDYNNNPLEEYFYNNEERVIDKWNHYFNIYHRHFKKFRGKNITLIEFGVFKGGSLQMWKHYFGKNARIIGVDINPECENLVEDQIEIYIGDQEDREFLKSLMEKIGDVDLIIEDGGHKMNQQINTFEEVWPYVKNKGIFLIEDLHTSYWEDYGGKYKKEGTFIEYSKNLIDYINAYYSRDENLPVNNYTQTIEGMHIYPSIIVFEKEDVKKPFPVVNGSEEN
ncbi:MAG: class I SAM-dependent methyltransferase [Methanobacteriaceae archaeon]